MSKINPNFWYDLHGYLIEGAEERKIGGKWLLKFYSEYVKFKVALDFWVAEYSCKLEISLELGSDLEWRCSI